MEWARKEEVWINFNILFSLLTVDPYMLQGFQKVYVFSGHIIIFNYLIFIQLIRLLYYKDIRLIY